MWVGNTTVTFQRSRFRVYACGWMHFKQLWSLNDKPSRHSRLGVDWNSDRIMRQTSVARNKLRGYRSHRNVLPTITLSLSLSRSKGQTTNLSASLRPKVWRFIKGHLFTHCTEPSEFGHELTFYWDLDTTPGERVQYRFMIWSICTFRRFLCGPRDSPVLSNGIDRYQVQKTINQRFLQNLYLRKWESKKREKEKCSVTSLSLLRSRTSI